MVIKWHALQKARARFRYMVWFMNSAQGARFVVVRSKSLSKEYKKFSKKDFPISSDLKNPYSGLVVLIDMNTYRLKKGRNFKTF